MVLAASSGSLSAIAMDAAIIPPLQTWFQLLLPYAQPGFFPFSGQLGLIPFSISDFIANSSVVFGKSPIVQSSANATAMDISATSR
ncbi:hypothetical protein SDC9_126979 [bioreactor metagenome]|uniref:Uncharacterized protein n=1 Tax=bioreactor metagenome TaxID=1076179 RepID=A0A645CS49_9ZZZZ